MLAIGIPLLFPVYLLVELKPAWIYPDPVVALKTSNMVKQLTDTRHKHFDNN